MGDIMVDMVVLIVNCINNRAKANICQLVIDARPAFSYLIKKVTSSMKMLGESLVLSTLD